MPDVHLRTCVIRDAVSYPLRRTRCAHPQAGRPQPRVAVHVAGDRKHAEHGCALVAVDRGVIQNVGVGAVLTA
jgi:hypothetical protein